jgi:hypothetical protein
MPMQSPVSYAGFATNMATNPENSRRITAINYFHGSVPEHLADLSDQAKNPRAPKEDNGEKAEPMPRVVYARRSRSGGKEGEKQPERLMTVQDVIDTLHLNPSTAWHWFTTGRLKERGRIWLAKPGGRSSPLVSLDEAEFINKNRPPTGRPPKRRAKTQE